MEHHIPLSKMPPIEFDEEMLEYIDEGKRKQ